MQTAREETFIMRNSGNPGMLHRASQRDEAAMIEFVIAGLCLVEIIGRVGSHCGATKDLIDLAPAKKLPALTRGLGRAEPTRGVVPGKYPGHDEYFLRNGAIQENELARLGDLRRNLDAVSSSDQENFNSMLGSIKPHPVTRSVAKMNQADFEC